MSGKIDIKNVARVSGGTLVTANSVTIDVRMLDAYHASQDTPQLKLPVVFVGKLDAVRKWAKTNKYKEVIDPPSLFGIHFSDSHGNSYILT